MDTYNDYYQSKIASKLKKIDLYLKTEVKSSDSISIDNVSELLDIAPEEINEISLKNNISSIDAANFFLIMKSGSSELCQLFNRQLTVGLSTNYSAESIAYIYQIPEDIILQAMLTSNIDIITSNNLQTLFSYIFINE